MGTSLYDCVFFSIGINDIPNLPKMSRPMFLQDKFVCRWFIIDVVQHSHIGIMAINLQPIDINCVGIWFRCRLHIRFVDICNLSSVCYIISTLFNICLYINWLHNPRINLQMLSPLHLLKGVLIRCPFARLLENKKGGGIVTHRQYCNLQPLRYC